MRKPIFIKNISLRETKFCFRETKFYFHMLGVLVTLLIMPISGYAGKPLAAKAMEIQPSDKVLLVKYLTGEFDVAASPEFTLIKPPLALRSLYIRKDVLQAYKSMQQAARKVGVNLLIISAFRSYLDQRKIWNKKYKFASLLTETDDERLEYVLKYSAPPGFSRHHWGTDIDLNAVSNEYFNTGDGKKVALWLDENSEKFGFFKVYTKSRRGGHLHEDWHYTFYPTASKYMLLYMNYVKPVHVDSFHGSHLLSIDEFFFEYVFNINKIILSRMSIDGLLE